MGGQDLAPPQRPRFALETPSAFKVWSTNYISQKNQLCLIWDIKSTFSSKATIICATMQVLNEMFLELK